MTASLCGFPSCFCISCLASLYMESVTLCSVFIFYTDGSFLVCCVLFLARMPLATVIPSVVSLFCAYRFVSRLLYSVVSPDALSNDLPFSASFSFAPKCLFIVHTGCSSLFFLHRQSVLVFALVYLLVCLSLCGVCSSISLFTASVVFCVCVCVCCSFFFHSPFSCVLSHRVHACLFFHFLFSCVCSSLFLFSMFLYACLFFFHSLFFLPVRSSLHIQRVSDPLLRPD